MACWAHFAENCMSGKIRIMDQKVPKGQKNRLYLKALLESSSFLYKTYDVRFSISRPLHPQNRAQTLEPKKVPKLAFRFSRVGIISFPS